jgi:membrane-bound lytic murein transglycosylase A
MPQFFESRAHFGMPGARALCLAALLVLAGCETPQPQSTAVPPPQPIAGAETPAPVPPQPDRESGLRRSAWQDLPGWREDDAVQALQAFVNGCRAVAAQDRWREACRQAQALGSPDRERARVFFEAHFTPYLQTRDDGGEVGMITGYYEPLLRGSRTRSQRYRYPVYAPPEDLLALDLAELHPETKGLRLRGRLEGRRIVPYYDRAQIEAGGAALAGKEIAWVEDAIELFFLQIQGSGRIALENGDVMRVGYADHNGHPYQSIGRLLVERGELPLEKASMQGIKAWARAHPGKVRELLNHNRRYVFFRELRDLPGPLGALGVPLTPQRSMAVDPAHVTLGAPVYIATTWPLSSRPLNRLMLAQDTGSAIRGAIRADFFWGFGDEAAREAGRMKQPLRMWVLLPNGLPAR